MVLFRLILFFIGDGAVQLLQGSDNAAAGLIHGFDTGGSCICGSHGCDVRDFLTDGLLYAGSCHPVCRLHLWGY